MGAYEMGRMVLELGEGTTGADCELVATSLPHFYLYSFLVFFSFDHLSPLSRYSFKRSLSCCSRYPTRESTVLEG